jgi:hypothetical protein
MGKSATSCRCRGYDNRSCIFGIHAAVFLKLTVGKAAGFNTFILFFSLQLSIQ